jgi:hypothetical protein
VISYCGVSGDGGASGGGDVSVSVCSSSCNASCLDFSTISRNAGGNVERSPGCGMGFDGSLTPLAIALAIHLVKKSN